MCCSRDSFEILCIRISLRTCRGQLKVDFAAIREVEWETYRYEFKLITAKCVHICVHTEGLLTYFLEVCVSRTRAADRELRKINGQHATGIRRLTAHTHRSQLTAHRSPLNDKLWLRVLEA